MIQDIDIAVIDKNRHLETVKSLWRKNSKTLGFFPDGAFVDYAEKKTILTALDGDGNCVGYLLYRCSREIMTITHLCTADTFRKKGVASKLVQYLIKIAEEARGLTLKCRTDYEANSFWPRVGFTVQRYVKGRGHQRKELAVWWRGHQDETLFTAAARRLCESKFSVVVDMNVLIDLVESPSDKTIPSKSLQADWLVDTIELFVTDEVFNEINRAPDPSRKSEMHDFATQFTCLHCDSGKFDAVQRSLRPLFPEKMTEQDRSDLRQVARAIAAEALFFVTRDGALLRIADEIQKEYNLVILTPTDLILRLDELRRTSEYQPVRFVQTQFDVRLVKGDDVDIVVSHFCSAERKEKHHEIRESLHRFLAEPDKYRCSIVCRDGRRPVALVVTTISKEETNELEVPMIRVCNDSLASTLAHQMIRQCLLATLQKSLRLTSVTDKFLQSPIITALYRFGFFETFDGWVKISLPVVETSHKIADRIVNVGEYISVEKEGLEEWADMLRDSNRIAIPVEASEQEHLLWPAKIMDADIPTYIVPVQPRWAQELFDEAMASQFLFGRKLELAFNTEAVYYRSVKGPHLIAPARILWYVSNDGKTKGAGHLRACSRLEQVEIGKPKDLYRKYRRLGIYEWQHVFKTANLDISKDIMALLFSDTELFSKPIRWRKLQEILKTGGIHSQIQQPCHIPKDLFSRLYSEAAELTTV